MFKIEFFVDDKNLAEALKGVAGRALDLKVLPVINAATETVAANGKRSKKIKPIKGNAFELILEQLRKTNPETFGAKDVKAACTKLGLAATSYGYYLKQAHESGMIKTTSGGGTKGKNFTYGWVK